MQPLRGAFLLAVACAACAHSTSESAVDAGMMPDAAADALPDAGTLSDAGIDAGPVDKAANCASSSAQLGTLLTAGHGRADGTVSAVVPPGDEACTVSANSAHMTIELLMGGKIERVVITATDTDAPDGKMHFLSKAAPLVGPPWAEGWHLGSDVSLDYVNDLQVHGGDFAAYAMSDLTAAVSAPINIGDRISLFATSDDAAGSALYGTRSHLVHRYSSGGQGVDGAIVVHPDANPTWLLFYYLSEKNF